MGSFIWLFQFLSFVLFLLHFQAISSSLVSSNSSSSNSSLVHNNLSNNKLHGTIPFSICNLKALKILDSLPKCLGKFSNNLEVLHLGMNNFNGTIPQTFSKGNSLRYINFNGNQLQGKVPSSISNCKKLEFLDLGNNKINDTFPYFLGALQQLQVLVLRSNKFHGLLQNFSLNYSFPMLRIFDISGNSLSGQLPWEYFDHFEAMMSFYQNMAYMTGHFSFFVYSVTLTLKGNVMKLEKILTLLITIDFSSNNFSGKIPKSIGKLKLLKQLNMSHNQLSGNIQPSLGNLTNLESLDLSSNLFTGRIPIELETLTFLEVFRVSDNQLEGPIPLGKQFNTFDKSSYEGNTKLCGLPLQKQCNNGQSERRTPQGGSNNDANGIGWEAVLIGYMSGVLFGLAIGFIVFRTRKHSWFVRMIEVEGYHWRKKFDKIKNTRK